MNDIVDSTIGGIAGLAGGFSLAGLAIGASGPVVGLSGAGITSGLSALGLGAGMIPGIGTVVAIIAGVTLAGVTVDTKAGIAKHITDGVSATANLIQTAFQHDSMPNELVKKYNEIDLILMELTKESEQIKELLLDENASADSKYINTDQLASRLNGILSIIISLLSFEVSIVSDLGIELKTNFEESEQKNSNESLQ